MRITEYFFLHLEHNVFAGNKSKMARALNIDQSEIYKIHERFDQGGGIGTVIEDTIKTLIQHHVSLDRLVQNYMLHEMDIPLPEQPVCPEMLELDAVREQWKKNQKKLLYCSRELLDLMDKVGDFLERVYCGEGRCPVADSTDPQLRREKCQCAYLSALMRLALEMFDFNFKANEEQKLKSNDY